MKCYEILVSQNPLHGIMNNRQCVLFVLDLFIERAEIRDLSDLVILLCNNEARKSPLGCNAFLKNSNVSHESEYFF